MTRVLRVSRPPRHHGRMSSEIVCIAVRADGLLLGADAYAPGQIPFVDRLDPHRDPTIAPEPDTAPMSCDRVRHCPADTFS